MENPLHVTLAFALVLSASFSTGYIKRWNKASSWGNAANWDKQRLPCLGDNIILENGVIFIDQNATVSGLLLPESSEIILREGKELSFADPDSEANNNCPREDMYYIGNVAREWMNPLNWDLIENGVISKHTNGMLYTDRVPCMHDWLLFPEDDAFAALIENNVEVSSLQLSNRNFTNPELQSYLSTNAGKQRFKFGGGSLSLREQDCLSPEGCACGTQSVKSAICSSFSCPPACQSSVTPDGECCKRCGSLIKMFTNQGFDYSNCQEDLRQTISAAGFSDVLVALSPVEGATSSKVQILFTDSQGTNSHTIGKKIYTSLSKDGGSPMCPGYGALFFPTEGSSGGTGSNNKSTIVLAVILSLVFLAIIIIIIFFVWKRSRRGGFSVKRTVLHNEMNIAGVQEMDYVESDFNGDPGKAKGASFENPVYDEMGYGNPSNAGAGAAAAAAPLPAKTPIRSNGTNGAIGLDNPVYDKEIDFSDTASNATAEAGQVNPLYTDLYEDKKPPPDDDDDDEGLEDDDDEPELMKAKLKIELDEEEADEKGNDNEKPGRDSEA